MSTGQGIASGKMWYNPFCLKVSLVVGLICGFPQISLPILNFKGGEEDESR
jgi:hypothetical protein